MMDIDTPIPTSINPKSMTYLAISGPKHHYGHKTLSGHKEYDSPVSYAGEGHVMHSIRILLCFSYQDINSYTCNAI